ncbi:hypothetical protein C0993_007974 [Termitomyces sp. T159_Od127]|nr:hypothetical protein C0993_007974 [Termitomyces sp. T159_Od127]
MKRTPNFAMEKDDVCRTEQPSINLLTLPSNKRLTLQHFRPLDFVGTLIAPHNIDVQQSNTPDWPPPEIFDLVYGSAVLKAWGLPSFREFALANTKHYYTEGRNRRGHKGQANRDESNKARAAKAYRRARRREHQAGKDISQQENLVPLVVALWDYRARKAIEQAHEARKKRLQEDALKWMSGVDEALAGEGLR